MAEFDDLRAFARARLDEDEATGPPLTRSALRLRQARRALLARTTPDARTLRALARQWQQHPGFDPRWRADPDPPGGGPDRT
jgi:hypothetical protein